MSADPASGLGERLAAPAIVVAPGIRVLERGRGYEEP